MFLGLSRFRRSDPSSSETIAVDTSQDFARADAFRDNCDWENAAQAYRAGLETKPESFRHWVQLGNVSKEAGQYQSADSAYLRALSLDAKNPDLHLQLGHLAKTRGNMDQAQRYFEQAAALDAESPDVVLVAAEHARDQSDWPDAISKFRSFLANRPTAGDIWIQLGHALKGADEIPQAEAAYRRGIDLGADPADGHLQIGHLYHRSGNLEHARRHYTLAVRAGCRDRIALKRASRSVLEPAILAALEKVRPSGGSDWKQPGPGGREPSFAALILDYVKASPAPGSTGMAKPARRQIDLSA